MACDAVYLYLLVIEKDIVANLESGYGCIQIGAHEIREIEAVFY